MKKEQFDKEFEYQEITKENSAGSWKPEGYYIEAYKGSESEIKIPKKVDGVKIIEINSLGNNTTLHSIQIPKSVIYTAKSFDGCSGLRDGNGNLVIGGKLLNVDETATKIIVSEGVTEIDKDAVRAETFTPNETIEEVVLPEGLEKINGGAFGYCKNLKRVHFPESLKEIGYNAFYNCESLEEVSLPEGLKKIGSYAFSGCKALHKISVSEGTVIEKGAFQECAVRDDGFTVVNGIMFNADLNKTAKSLVVPDDVKSISCYACFGPGRVVDEVILTTQVDSIEEDAFTVSGIECFKLIDKASGKPVFETEMFSINNGDIQLDYDRMQSLAKMLNLISNKKYKGLKKFGAVNIGNITLDD